VQDTGRRLLIAGWVFGIGSLVHILDHLRRGQGSISDELLWLGNAALVLQVVVVTLILVHHQQAPRWAAVAGIPLAIGFLGAHWLPEWSVLSDPIWEISDLTWLSITASLAEILGALLVAVAGIATLRSMRTATT